MSTRKEHHWLNTFTQTSLRPNFGCDSSAHFFRQRSSSFFNKPYHDRKWDRSNFLYFQSIRYLVVKEDDHSDVLLLIWKNILIRISWLCLWILGTFLSLTWSFLNLFSHSLSNALTLVEEWVRWQLTTQLHTGCGRIKGWMSRGKERRKR